MLGLSQDKRIPSQFRQMFKRRFIVMIKHWISALDKNRNELLTLLLQQLESASDIAVMFTVIECLNELIRTDYNCALNYEVILNASTPTVGHLLTHITSPNYIWQISQFLGNMLKNCGDQVNFNSLNLLNNLNQEAIIRKNPTLMKSVFADIFSIILKSTPNPAFIFITSLNYLNISLQMMNSEDVERILKFWVHFLRQTDASRSPQDQQAIQNLLGLFKQKFGRILGHMDQEENISALMVLVEELILADFHFENFSDFLEKLYFLCHRENNGNTIRLKNDFFSLVNSSFVYMQSKDKVNTLPLNLFLDVALKEMEMQVSESAKKSETRLKNQIMVLFGRLIFIETNSVLNSIFSKNINQKQLLMQMKVKAVSGEFNRTENEFPSREF